LPYYVETQGAKVIVHEPGTMPLPGVAATSIADQMDNELGLTLVRLLSCWASAHFVIVDRSSFQTSFARLEYPYNDPGCVADYDNFTALFNFTYTMKVCCVA
jgi:hypothetical protein